LRDDDDDDDNNNGSTARKRMRRHTFRRSNDGIYATGGAAPAAVNDGNVRELGFAPAFLLASNSRGGCREVPADDDDDDNDDNDDNDDDGRSPRGDASAAFARNMVSDHFRRQQRQQRQQQHRKSSEASNGYLVRRLRSLRDADRRAATTSLRGGGGGRYCTTAPGGSSNPLLLSSSRKRRRGGGEGDCPDPNRAAPSTLDVTVSGPPPSSSDPAFVGGGGGGTIVLLAYVHLHTVATRPPSGKCEGRRDGGTTLTGFSRLVMSRDAMREMGIVGDGRAKNLRLYGAVVIPPPRSAAAAAERTDADGDGANRDGDELRMIGRLPTIVCTNVCREYPVDQPPLRDVSFDRFSSTVGFIV
jgi:hypothetical protein